MGEVRRDGQGEGAVPATSAFRAARQLLDVATEEAARIVAEAERRARAREQEADLLVAKARRLLEAAEAKAAAIVAAARAGGVATGPAVLDLTDVALPRVVAPDATVLPRGSLAERIDEIVAAAVAHAVQEARPPSGPLDPVP